MTVPGSLPRLSPPRLYAERVLRHHYVVAMATGSIPGAAEAEGVNNKPLRFLVQILMQLYRYNSRLAADLGGERRGGKRGRGAPGKTPFVAAVETTA